MAAWLLAEAAIESAQKLARSTEEASVNEVASERNSFTAAQRRDSYAVLGRTARAQQRELSLMKNGMDEGHIPADFPATVGIAYRSVRDAAVDTNIVGDANASRMADCLVDRFYQADKVLSAMKATITPDVGAAQQEAATADEHLKSLNAYISQFIDYGRVHLLDPADAELPPAPDVPCLQPGSGASS